MCGIAGISYRHIGAEKERWKRTVEAMSHIMRHRGPDSKGVFVDEQVALAHARLAILDLSDRGAQPMTTTDGRYTICYNGEVYNYLELRSELRSLGHDFESDTDTEVLLKSYVQWGTAGLEKLNGMWAFAIWDNVDKSLFLSRDRVGIKPLYWCEDETGFAFASEIKGLLTYKLLQNASITLNSKAIEFFFQSGRTDSAENTFFKSVRRFRAGYYMIVKNGRIESYQPYWDLPKNALELRGELVGLSENDLTERLYDLLKDAISKHLRSDVPVGVCLSGGLDSSMVAATASQEIPDLKTFTSWYSEGEEWNELEHSDRINQAFNLKSYKVRPEAKAIFGDLEDIFWYLDEPSHAPGIISQWKVMEAASREVKVVLDGQGGDELFAGYDFYASYLLYDLLEKQEMVQFQNVLDSYSENYGQGRKESLLKEVENHQKQNIKKTLPDLFPGTLDNFLYLELTATRLPSLLRHEDRLSMAFSIESRVPYLDTRVIEFAFAIEARHKSGPGWSKYIMRKAVERLLPPDTTWRKDKKGYPTPFQLWGDTVLKHEIRSLLLANDSRLLTMLDKKELEGFFDQWDKGSKNALVLWRMLSLEIWFRSYLDRLRSNVRDF